MTAFETAVAKLRAAGWRIEEADVTWPDETSETAFSAVNGAASALLYGERHAADRELFGDNIAGLIERGRSVPGTDVVAASGSPMRARAPSHSFSPSTTIC